MFSLVRAYLKIGTSKWLNYNIAMREINSWQRPGHGSDGVCSSQWENAVSQVFSVAFWDGWESVARRCERGLQDEVRRCWIGREGVWVWDVLELWLWDRMSCRSTLCVSLKSELNKKIIFAISIVTIVYKLEEMYLFTVVYNRYSQQF